MEENLRKVIASPIPQLIYVLMKPLLNIFQRAIKFGYQLLAIFRSFF